MVSVEGQGVPGPIPVQDVEGPVTLRWKKQSSVDSVMAPGAAEHMRVPVVVGPAGSKTNKNSIFGGI